MTTPTTQHEADERAKFEAWHIKHFHVSPHRASPEHGGNTPKLEYWGDYSNNSWDAWQARAALAQSEAPAPGGVWIDSSGRAFGKVSDEQIEVVLEEALADVRKRSGLSTQQAAPEAPTCTHVWNDFGQLGGRNVSWCPRCDTLAWTGKEPEPATQPVAPEAPASEVHVKGNTGDGVLVIPVVAQADTTTESYMHGDAARAQGETRAIDHAATTASASLSEDKMKQNEAIACRDCGNQTIAALPVCGFCEADKGLFTSPAQQTKRMQPSLGATMSGDDLQKEITELEGAVDFAHDYTNGDMLAALTEIASLRKQVSMLEALRPHWAQGYTSDGVAAQCATDALNSLWSLLGARNQTQAVQRLRELTETANEFCDRVERQEVRSIRTYDAFLQALGRKGK